MYIIKKWNPDMFTLFFLQCFILQYIKFPRTLEQVREQQVKFHRVARFPQVVGAVDGTHVYLNGAPLGEEEYLYINRKGRYSINVQLVCTADYKITNCVARWPGSTHDSRILQVQYFLLLLFNKYNTISPVISLNV